MPRDDILNQASIVIGAAALIIIISQMPFEESIKRNSIIALGCIASIPGFNLLIKLIKSIPSSPRGGY